jgi:hypothetical protein
MYVCRFAIPGPRLVEDSLWSSLPLAAYLVPELNQGSENIVSRDRRLVLFQVLTHNRAISLVVMPRGVEVTKPELPFETISSGPSSTSFDSGLPSKSFCNASHVKYSEFVSMKAAVAAFFQGQKHGTFCKISATYGGTPS